MPDPDAIIVQEAELEYVASMTTTCSRAFRPTNPFFRRVFPDTPLIRQWYTEIFSEEISNPSCHIITAIDPNAENEALRAIGVLCMRLQRPNEPTAGFWTHYDSYTLDHDLVEFQPAIDAMVEHRMKSFAGETEEHYLLELFGVDHAYKGTGVGRRMLEMACNFGGKDGRAIFVEANASAEAFYKRVGEFEERGRVVMPGEVKGYEEVLLVREARKSNSGAGGKVQS